jgi:hypothetical protein
MEKWEFEHLSKEQKLRLSIMAVACGLAFYTVGVATNFFGSPIFSMFFIMNYNTVHGEVIYVAVAAAIALTLISLAVPLIKKPKLEFPQIHNRPIIRVMKTSDRASPRVSIPTNTLKMTGNQKNNKMKQKNQQPAPPAIKQALHSTVQTASQPYTVKNTIINQEADAKEKKGRLTCPNCKKEFSTPLLTLDYTASTPKLIRNCPYCYQPVD